MRYLDCTELKNRLDAGETPLLLDVRQPWEFAIAALAGSVNLPMSQISTAVQNWQHGQPDDEIIVVCHHGIRSLQVCRFLEANGFRDVVNLDGGIAAWSERIDPQMPTY